MELKEEALEPTVRRTGFGRIYELFVRKTTWWWLESVWSNIIDTKNFCVVWRTPVSLYEKKLFNLTFIEGKVHTELTQT